MKLASLEAALNREPFLPFELRVDGEVITVQHPEQVLLAMGKSTAVIDCNDRIHIVDIHQISKMSVLRRRASAAKAK